MQYRNELDDYMSNDLQDINIENRKVLDDVLERIRNRNHLSVLDHRSDAKTGESRENRVRKMSPRIRSRRECGWVVRQAVFLRSGRLVTSWWYGPDRSWGTTFGPLVDNAHGTLSIAVAVFNTRQDARDAIEIVGLKGCTPVPLDDALDITLDNEPARWSRSA